MGRMKDKATETVVEPVADPKAYDRGYLQALEDAIECCAAEGANPIPILNLMARVNEDYENG